MPERKLAWGYRYEGEKFRQAGLTPVPSESVGAPRVAECPVQMEGVVHDHRPFGKNVSANAFEVHIVKLHVRGTKTLDIDLSRPIDGYLDDPLILEEPLQGCECSIEEVVPVIGGKLRGDRVHDGSPSGLRSRGLRTWRKSRDPAERRRRCAHPGRR